MLSIEQSKAKIQEIKEEMQKHVKAAKLNRRLFEMRFQIDNYDTAELYQFYVRLQKINDDTFAKYIKARAALTEEEWERLQCMRLFSLTEWTTLRAAAIAWKNQLFNIQPKAKV
jgi:hypothetical protein